MYFSLLMVLLNECLFNVSFFFFFWFILLPPLTPSPRSVPEWEYPQLCELQVCKEAILLQGSFTNLSSYGGQWWVLTIQWDLLSYSHGETRIPFPNQCVSLGFTRLRHRFGNVMVTKSWEGVAQLGKIDNEVSRRRIEALRSQWYNQRSSYRIPTDDKKINGQRG